MHSPFSVIGGFFLRALFWLGLLLALWYWQRDWITAPVSWLAGLAMEHIFPAWVSGAEHEHGLAVLLTRIQVFVDGRMGELSPEVRILPYCYGLPLYAALLLASRARGLWWKLPLGALPILVFQAWGVSFNWLLQIAIHMSSLSAAATGFSELQVNLIGLGYQLGYLLFPTMLPFLLWLWLERAFITTVAVDGAMDGALSAATKQDDRAAD